ncbi:glycerol-3-phosphate dehydrogenase/oxidase [Gynurincola endophyticus]|uniref:glycerol-3-phosphate dehydrogenase/oxidase n=1 Tax=Gynurincola endophyticus TaxID=2479004 RepID=UPI000F8E6A24|nr:glycerol-3-phosphate dehydrogenase/oxidase [Gynurincola endophyticus]
MSAELQKYQRTRLLEQSRSITDFDVIVIGGGATGLGAALEAVTRGYKTLLLEQVDFAKGTSSKSTKLVHGGVRYLAQGDVKLVREASIERGLLVQNAPHLVRNQTFIIPVYSFFDRIKYTIGLKLYDWIAGKLSLGSSVFVNRSAVMPRISTIKENGLKGGVQYHDGQFDDARLAINLMQTIIDKGGVALNYMKVTGLSKNDQGILNGVHAIDQETQEPYYYGANAVINATGVFVDDVLKMEKPDSENTIRVSQGVHLVFDKKFWPGTDALMIPETSDGRVLFAVPWHNKVVVGTTDTPVEHASLDPVALEKEVNFILNTAAAYLKEAPTRSDVLSVFAGLRPLAAPKKGSQKTKEISRSHKVSITEAHLFTLLGGKWTTFRKMAEDIIDAIEKHKGWKPTQTQTRHLPVHGATQLHDWSYRFFYYGSDAAAIEEAINQSEENWLNETLQIHPAQVRWAIRFEQARTIEDFLSRRTRVLLLDADTALQLAPSVAAIMAKELNRDENWQQQQVKQFEELCKDYRLKH